MKRLLAILCLVVFLTACSGKNEELDRAMGLRAKMLAQAVAFDTKITADYGDLTYTFSMHCQADTQGNMTFQVTEPETIAGITGTVSKEGGKLTFDGQALAFDLMADGQISPVSAPWVLIQTLRGGYLTSCNMENDRLRVSIDDRYEDDALHLEVWLQSDDQPVCAEVYWQGRRLLTLEISNFSWK